MTMPPRGPRSVLCVVVVTNSAMPIGEGCNPAATSPAGCAMSAMSVASTSRAISPNGVKSICRGKAEPPAMMSLGPRGGRALADAADRAAAVVALPGISFRVLVGEDRAGGFEHRFGDEVLGGDQLEVAMLALGLLVEGLGDL